MSNEFISNDRRTKTQWTNITDFTILKNLNHTPQGPSHTPVPHWYAIDFFVNALNENGIKVKNQHAMLSSDTFKMIYLADVEPNDNIKSHDDFCFSIGFINNNDRTRAFTGIAGTHVYINNAEFFVSENNFRAKHITSVYDLLTERISSIILWFKEYYNSMNGVIEFWKNFQMNNDILGKFVLELIRTPYAISSTNVIRIVKNYDKIANNYTATNNATAWTLRNTMNEMFKHMNNPLSKLEVMNIFDNFFSNIDNLH